MNELLESAENAPLPASDAWRIPLEVVPMLVSCWTVADVTMDQGFVDLEVIQNGKIDHEGTYWSARHGFRDRVEGLWIGRRPDYFRKKFQGSSEERFISFADLRAMRLTLE